MEDRADPHAPKQGRPLAGGQVLRWLLLAAALAIVAGRFLVPSGPKVGEDAPDLALPLLGGGESRLSEFRGQVVVLDFWATWCPPCVDSLPTLGRVAREFTDQGLVTLAVNGDKGPNREQKVQSFLRAMGIDDLTVALDDGRAAGAMRVRALPTLVILDREGRVASSHVGALPEEALRSLLADAVNL